MKKIAGTAIMFLMLTGSLFAQVNAIITATRHECCNGDNVGWIVVNASGGTMPYTYTWTPSGGTKDTGTGLTAGTYSVIVTDNVGNTATAIASITQPTLLTANSTFPNNNTSCANPNGSVSVMAAGGTPPYTYTWTPSGETNANAVALAAGTYTCNVTDNNCCLTTVAVTIGGASGPIVTLSSTPDTHLCNGSASATVTGGVSPYTYQWFPGGQTTSNISGLCAGSFCIQVKDHAGCQDTACITVDTSIKVVNCPCSNNITTSIVQLNTTSFHVEVYPNPANSLLNIVIGNMPGEAEIYLTDVLGRTVYSGHKTIGSDYKETINIGSMPSGVYFLTIENNGQKVVKKVSKL